MKFGFRVPPDCYFSGEDAAIPAVATAAGSTKYCPVIASQI
jgi:hypothetical protein